MTAKIAIENKPPRMRPIDAIQEGNLVLMRLIDDAQVASPLAELPLAVQRHFDELGGAAAEPPD